MAARSVFGFQFSVFSFRFSVFGSRSISLDPGVSHHISLLTSHLSLLTSHLLTQTGQGPRILSKSWEEGVMLQRPPNLGSQMEV
jgi:hypothetical protein